MIANHKKLKKKSEEELMQNSSKKQHFLNSNFKIAQGAFYAEYGTMILLLWQSSNFFFIDLTGYS